MKTLLLTIAALVSSFVAAQAQFISFSSGAFALDGSSVETAGAVVDAVHFYRFNSSAITINGVSFNIVQTQTPGGSTTNPQTSTNISFNGGGIDGTGGGLTGATAAVTTLNSEGEYFGNTFTLSGLTVGTTYSAQFIFDANNSDYRATFLTDGANTSATVTGGIPGPVYITELFKATATTETIGRAGSGPNGQVQISGVVLESVAVPEPGTYALMGLGLAGLVFLARRQSVRA